MIAKSSSNKPCKVVILKRRRAVRRREFDNGDEVWLLVFEFLGNLRSQLIQFRKLSGCWVTREEYGEKIKKILDNRRRDRFICGDYHKRTRV